MGAEGEAEAEGEGSVGGPSWTRWPVTLSLVVSHSPQSSLCPHCVLTVSSLCLSDIRWLERLGELESLPSDLWWWLSVQAEAM